ncbi:MAG: ADP-ribosylglycohydrolase family protein [Verrucomicrobiaceae bacterium]
MSNKIEGLLLGIAVADSIGLPTEGMSPAKIKNLGWAKNLKHRFLFGRGMWSDDTEQTIMLTQALLSSKGDLNKFTRSFAWELRWWILGMPAATGMATARAIIKLWLGIPPHKSGVFSAGNGSAMRTAPIAAMFPNDTDKRRTFTEAQTRITHSDPKASIGAIAITELTALLLNCDTLPQTHEVIDLLRSISDDAEWNSIVQAIHDVSQNNQDIPALLNRIGRRPEKGISGYVYQTVPCVILSGLKNEWDFRATVKEIIAEGGDTDTTAAIAGALCGAYGGTASIPPAWIGPLNEWPTTRNDLSILARALSSHSPVRIRRRWSPFLLLRNVIFLATVLIHALARFLPFYLLKSKDHPSHE